MELRSLEKRDQSKPSAKPATKSEGAGESSQAGAAGSSASAAAVSDKPPPKTKKLLKLGYREKIEYEVSHRATHLQNAKCRAAIAHCGAAGVLR